MTEINTVEQWLGEDNKLGCDIVRNKYTYNNESFPEWLKRVSGGNKDIEKLILEKKFLFGGRTLTNRGTDIKGSYSNCYSSGFVKDDLRDIMKTNSELALTYKAQGGQGLSLTKLRPKGTPVGNGEYTSDGIIPFMKLFNQTTESISQGGSRKGALLMSIDVWHKQIEDFITIKSDLNEITKANLSVEIDDEFMQIVISDLENNTETTIHRKETYGMHKIEYDLIPIKIFRKLAELSWDNGEPAPIFVDRFRNYNIMEFVDDYQIEICNPCFTGDMKLLTNHGYKTFEELDGLRVDIVNINGDIINGNVWCSGKKETVKLILSNKEEIKCTPDHIFLTIDDEEVEARNLKGKKIMPYIGNHKIFDELYIKYGFIQGDGCTGRLDSGTHKGLEVNIGKKDNDVYLLFRNDKYTKSKRKIYLQGYNDKLIELGFNSNSLPNRTFPTTYDDWTNLQKSSFLQGCYSANGSVIKKHRISYKTTCKEFAEKLVDTLHKDFNIYAYITTNKAKNNTFSNGVYLCKESYDVSISRYADIQKFHNEINFYHLYKKLDLRNLLVNKAPYVMNIKNNGLQKVYDFNEPLTHWGVVEGYIAHNCGEQPLPKYGACNLGSINLSEFVTNPYTDKAIFEIEEFVKAVEIAITGLDEVLDEGIKLHALKEQREMAENYRNIGLGIMGLGSMFFKLGIKYGSQDSKELLHTIMFKMFKTAVRQSNKLAKEKGVFPKYSDKVWESNIIKNAFSDKEIKELKKNGLRNCSLLSIAPSGSIGTLLNITTGCEPAFAIKYQRKTESLHKDTDIYYDVYIQEAKEYMELNNTKELPDYFITSAELNWKDRVEIQAILQKYVDTSISSTVNLPNSATVEDIVNLYVYAWEMGCKGITVFREGCKRVGILTTKQNEIIEEKPKTELPWGTTIMVNDDVIGKKRKLTTGCGSLHCTAFFDPVDGRLMELYLNKGSTGGCNNFMTGLSRMISHSARTGANIESIVDQLMSSGTCPSYSVRNATKHDVSKGSSCPVAIGYALKDMYKEIRDELGLDDEDEIEIPKVTDVKKNKTIMTANEKSERCPECGERVQNTAGCVQCPSCGWSRCS
jgi:ribonucleotide reductase alpha subunit